MQGIDKVSIDCRPNVRSQLGPSSFPDLAGPLRINRVTIVLWPKRLSQDRINHICGEALVPLARRSSSSHNLTSIDSEYRYGAVKHQLLEAPLVDVANAMSSSSKELQVLTLLSEPEIHN
jgi:hypothetical protein